MIKSDAVNDIVIQLEQAIAAAALLTCKLRALSMALEIAEQKADTEPRERSGFSSAGFPPPP